MDLLASYNDENNDENSVSNSPNLPQLKAKSNVASNLLENEWLSFEQMIAPGSAGSKPEAVNSSDFLVNGIVAYPGMKGVSTSEDNGLALEEQSSASSDSETEAVQGEQSGIPSKASEEGKEEDDDAFFKLRKQVKERDRSSSTDRSGSSRSSSASSSKSRSPSPPHLSPVNSIKSHTSEPPDLTERVDTPQTEDVQLKAKEDESSGKASKESRRSKSKDRKRSRSRDRKRSHRDHKSRHDHGSSRSKRKRSRSRSKDRKHRRSSRDRHRRKDKKSRDQKKSRSGELSRDRKDSKSESRKSEGRERKESNSEIKDVEKVEEQKSDQKERRDSKSDGHRKRSRSRSKDRKDKKKDRKRSRSRHRHRSRSKDRKDRKRSRSRERKRKHRSRSRHRSRDRNSRSRSRERLRSRSPVLGRKLTFKEQMRKQFINASKEAAQESKVTDLDSLRRPGEALRPSDLLKGVKLNSGESVTPQMALMQTMAAMHKKAQELTGVEVPKYYNPAAVNPLKYAEQVQKRKLLWSKKTEEKDKNEQMETQWKSAFVAGDDSKTASKFRKLMGMKEGEAMASGEGMSEDVQKMSEEQHRKQAELFQRLDQEYQFARMTTHTQRGVGLGFSTTVIDPNHPQNPP